MSDAAATIERLYAALQAGDGDAMAACYVADATFEDPAFGRLEGPEVGAMWRMLTSRGTGVSVNLREHAATGTTGTERFDDVAHLAVPEPLHNARIDEAAQRHASTRSSRVAAPSTSSDAVMQRSRSGVAQRSASLTVS